MGTMYRCIFTQRICGCYTTYYLQTSSVPSSRHRWLSPKLSINIVHNQITSLRNGVALSYYKRKQIILSFRPQKQVSVVKIWYSLLHENLVQSEVIRTFSFQLASLHQTPLGIKFSMFHHAKPPKKLDQIQGCGCYTGKTKLGQSNQANRTQQQKKNDISINIGPSQTATLTKTTTNPQTLKGTTSQKITQSWRYWVPKPFSVHA